MSHTNSDGLCTRKASRTDTSEGDYLDTTFELDRDASRSSVASSLNQ